MFFTDTKSILSKAIEYTVYLFLITFPFINYSLYLYSGTSTRSVNLTIVVSVLSIILGVWLFGSKNKLSLLKSPILAVFGAYIIISVISGLYGFNFHTTFWSNVTRMTGIWYLVTLYVFIVFLTSILSDERRGRRMMSGVMLSTGLYSLLYFFSYEGLGWIFPHYVNYAFTFGNSTFAAMYLFGAFMLAVYYLYTSEKRVWWMYILPIILIINPSIINKKFFIGEWSGGVVSFVGEARASSVVIMLSIIALICVWLISRIKNKKIRNNTIVGVFITVILGLGFVGYSLLSPDGIIRKAYLSQATSARPLVWEVSNKVIADSPFLGWGGDNFERVFERYYDNRLLQREYGNEAWFDRAHNVFVDQAIDGGYIGLISYLLIYLCIGICLLYVVLKSRSNKDVALATILLIYFGMHFLELQTAFDTSISYVMVAFMIALSTVVTHRTFTDLKGRNYEIDLGEGIRYVIGLCLVGFFMWTTFTGLIPFMRTQWANGYIREVGSSAERLKVYDTLFGSSLDLPSFLWRTSTDLQKGIGQDPSILENPADVQGFDEEFNYLANKYAEYLKLNPNDYRSHLNLADILIYLRLFNDDKLEQAQSVLDDAIKLVPQGPQAYWMKAVAYIYERKFDLAREWAAKGLAVNPKIKESQNIIDYVDESIKTFPNIDLYFFKQT